MSPIDRVSKAPADLPLHPEATPSAAADLPLHPEATPPISHCIQKRPPISHCISAVVLRDATCFVTVVRPECASSRVTRPSTRPQSPVRSLWRDSGRSQWMQCCVLSNVCNRHDPLRIPRSGCRGASRRSSVKNARRSIASQDRRGVSPIDRVSKAPANRAPPSSKVPANRVESPPIEQSRQLSSVESARRSTSVNSVEERRHRSCSVATNQVPTRRSSSEPRRSVHCVPRVSKRSRVR